MDPSLDHWVRQYADSMGLHFIDVYEQSVRILRATKESERWQINSHEHTPGKEKISTRIHFNARGRQKAGHK
jgi:hypothetical protein